MGITLSKAEKHYFPTPSRISKRFAFRQVIQKEGESINHYMASLRAAAPDCEFHDLDGSLLEQLVCGVRDLWLQHHLLARTELNLQTTIDEACVAEMSHKSIVEIQQFHSSVPTGQSSAVHEASDQNGTSEEEGDVS